MPNSGGASPQHVEGSCGLAGNRQPLLFCWLTFPPPPDVLAASLPGSGPCCSTFLPNNCQFLWRLSEGFDLCNQTHATANRKSRKKGISQWARFGVFFCLDVVFGFPPAPEDATAGFRFVSTPEGGRECALAAFWWPQAGSVGATVQKHNVWKPILQMLIMNAT